MKKLQDKTNVDAPDATWLYGDLNDNPGDNSGTPVNKELLTDALQLMERVFDISGITANGLPDNEANDWQLYDAFLKVFKGYYEYTALISQSGTSDPTVTVIKNTLPAGAIVWARSGVGVYTGTLAGAFIANKTVGFINSTGGSAQADVKRTSNDVVTLSTFNITPAAADALLTASAIEIRVYI